MPAIVAVTEKEYRKAKPVFEAAAGLSCVPVPPEEDALAAAIRHHQARHAVVGVVPYRGPLYAALPAGAVLARFGVGHDNIDKAQATAAGLLVTNTPGALVQSVAEHTILLMLAAVRHFEEAAAAPRAGEWPAPVGGELSGKRLAVIGLGSIGRAVARIAAAGFGMRVRGCVREPAAAAADGFEAVTISFAEAVADADFVSLHLAARPATAHYLNAERLAALPSHAWLINTARGSVVDERALYEALASGRLAGAALDVFEHEPYRPVEPLADFRRLGNVIMTPHIASNTAEANRRMAERTLQNIALAESGQPRVHGPVEPGSCEAAEKRRGTRITRKRPGLLRAAPRVKFFLDFIHISTIIEISIWRTRR